MDMAFQSADNKNFNMILGWLVVVPQLIWEIIRRVFLKLQKSLRVWQ